MRRSSATRTGGARSSSSARGGKISFETGRGTCLRGARQLLTDRVLALTVLRRFDEPEANAFMRVLLDGVVIWPAGRGSRLLVGSV